ncbi:MULTISPECIES: hypothetical protein [unclassified Streptomyces]|uniref:hypothetical protein n=1 Tax=unclassified Streptomyces TaxID=2593676 RepID=UPI00344C8AF2
MTIIVGGMVFGGPNPSTPGQQIPLLVQALTQAGITVGSYGRILATWIKSADPHTFTSYAELVQKLTQLRAVGAQINQTGDDLENSAAATVGAWPGRGAGQVPTWAADFARIPAGGQDPNVYAANGAGQIALASAPVKPDIWSEHLLGIVGGRAKEVHLAKFTTICHDLVRVCASHGKRPVVFTAFGATDTTTTARAIVGAENTYVQDVTGGPWRPLG